MPGDNLISAALKSLIGRHTIVVVPVQIEGKNQVASRKVRKLILREVARFWSEQVPGMSLKFVIKKGFSVPKKYCDRLNYTELWDRAERQLGPSLNFDKKFNHLAVIQDCAVGRFALGIADVAPGYGRLASLAWDAQTVAHEFGHNLGLDHSNQILCKTYDPIKPRKCDQLEYEDSRDVMGIAGGFGGLRAAGVFGAWRALFFGYQELPSLKRATTVRLERSGGGRVAQPLWFNSKLGPLFIDLGMERQPYDGCPTAFWSDHDVTPIPMVEMRVATRNGDGYLAGQGALPIRTARGPVNVSAGPFQPFDIPGTSSRAYVLAQDANAVNLRVVPRRDSTPPKAIPDADFPRERVAVVYDESGYIDYSGVADIELPVRPDLAGYLVEQPYECTRGFKAGETARISLLYDYVADSVIELPLVEAVITPVGKNGVLGTPITVNIQGERLELVDTTPKPYSRTFAWSVAGRDEFLRDIDSFTLKIQGYSEESEWFDSAEGTESDGLIRLVTLPASARNWSPSPDMVTELDAWTRSWGYVTAHANGLKQCERIKVSALAGKKVLTSVWIDWCVPFTD